MIGYISNSRPTRIERETLSQKNKKTKNYGFDSKGNRMLKRTLRRDWNVQIFFKKKAN
jgi:hypothetical protein